MLWTQIGELSTGVPGLGDVTMGGGTLVPNKPFDDTYSAIKHPAVSVPVRYKITAVDDATKYEFGRGLYTKSGSTKTLVRSKVYTSSVANAPVNFTTQVEVRIVADAYAFGPEVGCHIYALTGGTTVAYTVRLSPPLPEVLDGMVFLLEFDQTCGAAPTVTFDNQGIFPDVGPFNLVDNSLTNIASGVIVANYTGMWRYRAAGGGKLISIGELGQSVRKAGDTMSGDLEIEKANAQLILNAAAAGQIATTRYQTAGVDRWVLGKGSSAEGGANAGSEFFLLALSDAGAAIDSPITVVRAAAGAVTIIRPTQINATLGVTGTATMAAINAPGFGISASLITATDGTNPTVIAPGSIEITNTGGIGLVDIKDNVGDDFDIRMIHTGASGMSLQAAGGITVSSGPLTISGGATVPSGGIATIGGLSGSALTNEAGALVLRFASSPNTAFWMSGTEHRFYVNGVAVASIDANGIAGLPFKKFAADGTGAALNFSGLSAWNPRYLFFMGQALPTGGGGPYTFTVRGLRADGTTLTTVTLATSVSSGVMVTFWGYINPCFAGVGKQMRLQSLVNGGSQEDLAAGSAGPTDALDQLQMLFSGSNISGNIAGFLSMN